MDRKQVFRKVVFFAATIVLVICTAEFVSWVGIGLLSGRFTGLVVLSAEREAIASTIQMEGVWEEDTEAIEPWILGMRQEQVLHPYLGFVDKPHDDLQSEAPRYVSEGNEFGFPQNFYGLFLEGTPKDVVVVVVGGSVAHQIAAKGRPVPFLERTLSRVRRFDGKDVRVLNLALGGYKQPQQLALLNYFLALGMDIDILINVDGFNEVTLPVKDNISVNVNPFYPRSWNFRVEAIDSGERRLRGEIAFLDALRREVASAFSRTPLQYSFTAGFVWRTIDTRIRRWGAERESSLLERTSNGRTLEVNGPPFHHGSDEALYDELVAVWRRSSIQMQHVAQGQGIEYFHFLQPNQYDIGSKELSAQELNTAWDPESRFVESVAFGYPKLREESVILRESGVRFFDLTGIFREYRKTIYVDPCCHFNAAGVEVLAGAIAEAIEDEYEIE